MSYVDPYKVLRNSATLRAYRDHQRAARAAAQPWITIAAILGLAQIGLLAYVLSHNFNRAMSLAEGLNMLAFGLAAMIAAIQSWRFRRANPYKPPVG